MYVLRCCRPSLLSSRSLALRPIVAGNDQIGGGGHGSQVIGTSTRVLSGIGCKLTNNSIMVRRSAHRFNSNSGALTCERLRNGESAHSVPEHDAVATAVVGDGHAVAVPRNVWVWIALDDALETGHGAVNDGNVFQRLHRQQSIGLVRVGNMFMG